MKKIFCLLIIIAVFLTLVGCQENTLLEYKESSEKTDQISKGKASFNIKIKNYFDYEGLTDDEIKKLNYFKDIEVNSIYTFDNTKEEIYMMLYFNFGGLGYDTEAYLRGGETIVRIPIINKYIIMNNKDIKQSGNNKLNNDINEYIFIPIQEKWMEILNSENVVKGEKSILATEDGDVKVTKYTITPSDEQTKDFIMYCLDTVISNEKLLIDMIKLANDKDNISLKKTINSCKEMIEKEEKINFQQTIYIDIDGYITKEIITFNIIDMEVSPKAIKESITIEVNNWDIEMEQDINFPTINSDDIIDIEDSEGSFMFFMEEK